MNKGTKRGSISIIAYNAPRSKECNAALNAIYSEAGYDLSINYSQTPPPPAFSKTDIEWMHFYDGKLLKAKSYDRWVFALDSDRTTRYVQLRVMLFSHFLHV